MNIVFLHGLFGSPHNWDKTIASLAIEYDFCTGDTIHNVQLPIDNSVVRDPKLFGGIKSITEHVDTYIKQRGLNDIVLVGNSLGGQIAIDYAHTHPQNTKALILTGSAGLYERALNGNGAKVKTGYEAIAASAAEIFYDKNKCTEEIVRQAYDALQDRKYARFLIRVAKATRDYNVEHLLPDILCPTALIWGLQDKITPPEVAEHFYACIPHSELYWIDECGHSPTLEKPVQLAFFISDFIKEYLNG